MDNKRDYSKFFTPPEIADFMARRLRFGGEISILEPSAGNGRLIKAVRAYKPGSSITAVEINPEHEYELARLSNEVHIKDFLKYSPWQQFDACISNPPFGNETDLGAHVNHMRKCVKQYGKIILIAPADFNIPQLSVREFAIENWSSNKDGTTTPIKIIEFINS